MNTAELSENYVESLYSSFICAMEKAGVPIPAVTLVAEEDNSPYRILTSTILSLRTQDSATREASEALFKVAPTINELYSIDEELLAKTIKKAGFYLRKASQLKQIARIVVEEWKGEIPPDREKLMSLPGVGIKTANLVLNLSFGVDAICVDCHVHQIANRLGWVETATPEETEKALQKVLPKAHWIRTNEILVMYGQSICTPLSPRCSLCPASSFCPGKEREARTR